MLIAYDINQLWVPLSNFPVLERKQNFYQEAPLWQQDLYMNHTKKTGLKEEEKEISAECLPIPPKQLIFLKKLNDGIHMSTEKKKKRKPWINHVSLCLILKNITNTYPEQPKSQKKWTMFDKAIISEKKPFLLTGID